MNEIKNDYDFNAQVKLIAGKKEAQIALRTIRQYRFDCIEVMNKIISLKRLSHESTNAQFEKLLKEMTKLHRKLYIMRKTLNEFKAARRKIMSVKNKDPHECT